MGPNQSKLKLRSQSSRETQKVIKASRLALSEQKCLLYCRQFVPYNDYIFFKLFYIKCIYIKLAIVSIVTGAPGGVS